MRAPLLLLLALSAAADPRPRFELEVLYVIHRNVTAESYRRIEALFLAAYPDFDRKTLGQQLKAIEDYFSVYRERLLDGREAALVDVRDQVDRELRVRAMFERLLAEARERGSVKAVFDRLTSKDDPARPVCGAAPGQGLLVYRHVTLSGDELEHLEDSGVRFSRDFRFRVVQVASPDAVPRFPPRAFTLGEGGHGRQIFRLLKVHRVPDPATGGTVIVLNKAAHTATFLDRAGGAATATLETGDGPHEGAVSPDGTRAVVCNYGARRPGNTLTVYSLDGPKVEKTIDLGPFARPHGIAFLSDGKRVVVTAEGKQALIVVDLDAGRVVRAVDTGQMVSHMVALHGPRAYVANIFSGSMTAIDLEKGERLKIVPTGRGAEGIDVAPDGREVWVTNRAANTVTVVDAAKLEVVATIPCADFPIRAKFTPDGARVLVSCAKSGDIAVLDAKTRKEVARVSLKDPSREEKGTMFRGVRGPLPVGILVPPDGKHAFVACGNYDQVAVLDLATLAVVARHATGREPDGLAYAPR